MNTDLERFVKAQESDYATALAEIINGRKKSHWIWYIFPQLKGLGHSYNSNYYGIADFDEAKAYMAHTVLGARLREISRALLELPKENTAREVFGGIDAMKVKSSMTLFYLATKEELFKEVLDRYYAGKVDSRTIELLRRKKEFENNI